MADPNNMFCAVCRVRTVPPARSVCYHCYPQAVEGAQPLAINKLIAVCCTCKKRNTPEWMAYFAELINAAIAEQGSGDRAEWPGDWSNEFHLISG